jgi:hypothetical protein
MATPGRFSLFRNAVTIFGAATTTSSALLFVAFFALEMFGMHSNPYLGMLFFVVFPALFIVGLIIMPVGIWLERRRRRLGVTTGFWAHWPTIDLNQPWQRRTAGVFILATVANLLIITVAAYKGVEYMDSVGFCGQLCHRVMEPEWAGYQEGPHSRVLCIQCHIGPGANWFVKSKMSGTRQVFAVTFNTFSRPIPSPVTDLRPARDTCEQCHWPEKFHGDKIREIREFAEDQANSESKTTLQMHIGGVSVAQGRATGIHWHVGAMNRVEYVATDDKRQVIPYVKLDDGKGNTKEYRVEGVTDQQLAGKERRTLDCIDCHNRPSHTFALSAERAVDSALASGDLDPKLPFVRREAVRVLKTKYATRQAAVDGIAAELGKYYREQQPGAAPGLVKQAVDTTQRLFARNVFPEMNVAWGTYPNNIGHTSFPGCFRCHDDNHKSGDGKVISQDCGLCHKVL